APVSASTSAGPLLRSSSASVTARHCSPAPRAEGSKKPTVGSLAAVDRGGLAVSDGEERVVRSEDGGVGALERRELREGQLHPRDAVGRIALAEELPDRVAG